MTKDNKVTLIFDFDGTIADTIAFTINSALEINRKLKLLSTEKIDMEKFRSMDANEFFKEIDISFVTLLYYVYRYQRALTKEIDSVKTFEGLPEVLSRLKEMNVKMGIVTSNSKKNVKRFLLNNDLQYFDFVYSTFQYFKKDKAILKAIKKFKLDKENVIYVGDEIRDIKAAKKAGIKIASVSWGYNFDSVLTNYNPDYLISKPEDLLNIL